MGKKGSTPARFVIDENQLKEICTTAANEGIRAYREEHELAERERQSRVLNNAKTLVQNYRKFKMMSERSVYNEETCGEIGLREIIEMMSGKFRNSEFEVMSIKERAVRTRLIMEHVDTMLDAYRMQCNRSHNPEDMRRFRIVHGLFLADEPKTVQDLSEEEAITVSTVYRDCDKAYRELAVLFFGIDGIRLPSVQRVCEKRAIDTRRGTV